VELSRLLDFQITYTVLLVLLTLKFGDWKNWQLYYPTILYYAVVYFTYALLCYNFPLWEYESPLLKTTGSDLLLTLIAAPATIILYLTYLNKILLKSKAFTPLYITAWVAFLTIVEWTSYQLGFFSYFNNWSIWWSLLFNCTLFPMLWLHFKKPLWAILLAFVFAIMVLTCFHVPFSSMK